MNSIQPIAITPIAESERAVAVPIQFATTRRRREHAAGHYLIQLRQRHRWQWVARQQEPGTETGFPR